MELFFIVGFVGLIIWGIYETKKKYGLKEKELELEREKIALESKKIDLKE
ncbi:hypothetical protein PRVXH_000824 [Proteinivorax hydrogeniformans]|uniref:Uncharacterized protein n=1 Tax=Proteinivorax hydrogeniformans TaxID=1826727 RepID=A0AAU8HVV7_9FIRM